MQTIDTRNTDTKACVEKGIVLFDVLSDDTLQVSAALFKLLGDKIADDDVFYTHLDKFDEDVVNYLKSDKYDTNHVFVHALDKEKIDRFDVNSNEFISYTRKKREIREKVRQKRRRARALDTEAFQFNRHIDEEVVNEFLRSNRCWGDKYLLLRYVETELGFRELVKLYDALYKKHYNLDSQSFAINEDDRTIHFPDDDELEQILTEEELALFKFTAMTDITEPLTQYADSWRRASIFLKMKKDLKGGDFRRFGIMDHTIDKIWLEKKMHYGYFTARIRQGKKPNPYACGDRDGELKEYVSKDTEVVLWRAHTDYMKKAIDWTIDMCEPEDRG